MKKIILLLLFVCFSLPAFSGDHDKPKETYPIVTNNPMKKLLVLQWDSFLFLDARNKVTNNGLPLTPERTRTIIKAISSIDFYFKEYENDINEQLPFFYEQNSPLAKSIDESFRESGNTIKQLNSASTGLCGNTKVADTLKDCKWTDRGFFVFCYDDQGDGTIFGINKTTAKIERRTPHFSSCPSGKY